MSQQPDPLDISHQAEPVDKISVLQAISIFANTPRAILAEVADMLEEIEFKTGNLIFAKGDLGTSMYMVVTARSGCMTATWASPPCTRATCSVRWLRWTRSRAAHR